ncbi:MAG: choice-of-anchor D domain-containing protein [Ahniella sp.]|nr:choice-of-anchor D domain-containing protein [Ahniella sp.]
MGFPAHSIAHLTDGQYGNDFSWVNDVPAPFAGVALGASRSVNQIAFGRDNTGGFSGDRTFGVFTLQYTNVPNPGANTPAGSWTTIGTLDYQFAGGLNFATPSRRHVFSFNPVTATALRLVSSTGNNAIDELEIYRQLPELIVEQPAGSPLTHNTGSVDFGNLSPGDSSTKTFTLTNSGNAPLNLDTLFLTGAHLAQFSLTPPVSNTLVQGESTTFSVTFAPGMEGPLTALLHIPSNNPDIADFLIPLVGVSRQPPVISGYANLTNAASGRAGPCLLYPAVTATDDSGLPPSVSYSHPSGALFPIGVTTVTITATDNFNISATASFTVTITAASNPPPVPLGGAVPQNLARGRIAFAKDVVPVAPHTIAKVNDGLYGNANSWIADTLDSFVGINLGATPIAIDRVAFGRDHTGVQTTRSDGIYTLQYTTVPNPDSSTPDASWGDHRRHHLPRQLAESQSAPRMASQRLRDRFPPENPRARLRHRH